MSRITSNTRVPSSTSALINPVVGKSPTSSNLRIASSTMDRNESPERPQSWKSYVTVAILFSVNLLNYMDRFTIAGVLKSIKVYFDISDVYVGLLQTAFICSYMTFAPVFGYLGDRYSRRFIIIAGISVWSIFSLSGSFVKSHHFGLFLLFRGLVGVGEASYSCVAPSLLADLYEGDTRSKILALYYLAIPVGSGLGYVIGSKVAAAAGHWTWALRVTPGLCLIAVILVLFCLKEPARGLSDSAVIIKKSGYIEDLKYLSRNKSFIFTTLSFTAVAFVIGALSWWSPIFMELAYEYKEWNTSSVSLIFGIITCTAGILGVLVGSYLSRRYKQTNPRADPVICGYSVLSAVPFLFAAIFVSKSNIYISWLLTFIAITLMCFTWSLITDIVMYVVVPSRRSTAESVQILISHLLGDAGSPYIVGLISDTVKARHPFSGDYKALMSALYINPFVAVIAGGGFLLTSFFVVNDRRIAELHMKGSTLKDSFEEPSIETKVAIA